MGNTSSSKKINFEDVQYAIKNKEFTIINTLTSTNQYCLILNTINCNEEEVTINNLLNLNTSASIIVYGKNSNDESIYKKINQLNDLGFVNVYLYTGGLFEWLLLQDIYGSEMFPTTVKENDILKFKPNKLLNIKSINYDY